MATKVPIEIFLIGKSRVEEAGMKAWLRSKQVSEPGVARLVDDPAATDAVKLVGNAAKRCYAAFEPGLNPNVQRVRTDWLEYIDNILKSGHGSVLEHVSFTFAIENVSRVFTGELNRHRAGWAISEGSMRYIRFGEAVPYWEPTSIQGPDVFVSESKLEGIIRSLFRGELENEIFSVAEKKHLTRRLFELAFDAQRETYAVLERLWKAELAPESTFQQKKELTSLFRRIVGMGCATGGVWTGNVRALRHVIALRCSPAAEEEILHVFGRVAQLMVESEPALFGDFSRLAAGYWVPRYPKV